MICPNCQELNRDIAKICKRCGKPLPQTGMTRQPEKRFTIFISSTFIDLQEYREAARSAILGLRNHVSDMIYWSADERDPKLLSLEELRQSDLVILILAHRYGTIPQGETRSITEIEFDTAIEERKPVIPFFVDQDYEWPGTKFEAKQYDKLLTFKEKVVRYCTPRYFTTRDSLAALVTTAVVNFDKRHRTELETPRIWTPPLAVNPTTSIDDEADTLFPIGQAEDGLPMVLVISRSDSLGQPVSAIVKAVRTLEEAGFSTRLDSFNSYMKSLLKDAERVWTKRGIQSIQMPDGVITRGYVTRKTLSELFSSSLLAFLLPAPVVGDFEPRLAKKISTTKLADRPRSLPASGIDRIQSTGGQNRFLAISPSTGDRSVVGRASGKSDQFCLWHVFIPESLSGFSECEYECRSDDKVLSRGKMDRYLQAIRREFESLMDDDGRSNLQVTFRISRRAVGRVILQILDRLGNDYHKRKVIHGDVKPQNCLVTPEGARLIDSLELSIGEIPPALSPVWAAPEQIAVRTVSEATDIYPVGLMLVSLLSGEITGEIVRYQLPSAEGKTIVSFIRDPFIYLNASDPTIPKDGRTAWLEFIEKCLRFDPKERFATAADCAAELGRLLDKYPPSGWLSLQLQRGDLQMVRLPDGQDAVCRILRDESYGSTLSQSAVPRGFLPTGVCPICHAQNEPSAMFCNDCGGQILPSS